MSNYKVRDWVLVGLFGALWGVVETTLGTYLNVIFPSFTNTFFKGVILGSIGVAVALTGRYFIQKRWSVVLISIITALLKTLSPGGSRIGPILAVLMQGALMELVLSLAGAPHAWAYVLGGALAVGWNFPHKFLMMWVMYGRNIVQVAQKLAQDGSSMLGLDSSMAFWILATLLGVRMLAGGVAGWGAWALATAVAERRGQRGELATE